MPTISWKPLPKTIEDPKEEGYQLGAMERARHRRLMVLRWRNKDLRAQDRKQRRLPTDWHDWMFCPAEYGYGSRWCTCDEPINNAPRELVRRDREVRDRLQREALTPFKDLMKGKVTPRPSEVVAITWVKSIDAFSLSQTMAPHAGDGSVRSGRTRTPLPGRVALGSRLAQAGSRPLTVRASATAATARHRAGWRTSGRLGRGHRLRLPAWLARARHYVSMLWSARSAAG